MQNGACASAAWMRASESISRGPFSGKPAASLHVPHKEKRLHPTKAFARMRQVSPRERSQGKEGERKRGVKREGGFYRKDAVKSLSLAHFPTSHRPFAGLSSIFRVPSSFLSSPLRGNFARTTGDFLSASSNMLSHITILASYPEVEISILCDL